MPRQVLPQTPYPTFIGPFSKGTRTGDFIFTSNHVPYDRVADTIVKGDIRTKTWKAMRNVQEILAARGATLDDLIKLTLFIRNYADCDAINAADGEFSTPTHSARALVEVATLPQVVGLIIGATTYVGPERRA